MMLAGVERKADANMREERSEGTARALQSSKQVKEKMRTGREQERERGRESALRRRRGKDLKKTVKATGVRDGKGCGLGASQPSIAPGQPLDGGQ